MTILTFEEFILHEDQEYQQYLEAINLYEQFTKGLLTEDFFDTLTGGLKDKINFIKDIVSMSKQKADDIIKLFKNSEVFHFFKNINWDIKNLINKVKEGYKAYQEFGKVIHEFLLKNKYTHAATKWTDEQIKKLHDFLEEHPTIKHLAGPVISGLLLYCWLNGANFGHIGDFNTHDIFNALAGKYHLYDLLGDGMMLQMLVSVILAAHGLSISYGALDNITKFLVGTLIALEKQFKISVHIK